LKQSLPGNAGEALVFRLPDRAPLVDSGGMTRVRIDLFASLDGYSSTTDATEENPMGEDWGRLTAAYAATRTFRASVLGDTSGSGTTGLDDA